MKNRLTLLLIVLAMLLAACQSQNTPVSPPATEASSPALTQEAASPAESEQPAATALVGPVAPPGCTVVSQETTPDEESPFLPITEQDWTQGPEDAYVTILEYGDFQ